MYTSDDDIEQVAWLSLSVVLAVALAGIVWVGDRIYTVMLGVATIAHLFFLCRKSDSMAKVRRWSAGLLFGVGPGIAFLYSARAYGVPENAIESVLSQVELSWTEQSRWSGFARETVGSGVIVSALVLLALSVARQRAPTRRVFFDHFSSALLIAVPWDYAFGELSALRTSYVPGAGSAIFFGSSIASFEGTLRKLGCLLALGSALRIWLCRRSAISV